MSPQPFTDTWGIRPVLFLVAALLLFGVLLGTVAHAPLPFSVAVGAVIAVWLGVFALRERHGRGRGSSAH
ncbi:hypothetical protein [Streptomyces sp. enrichment culture]|uniref:hypothetical protein n=1 Tax=Streptomyces sp. enrichment culture TaxID=1795815 RepID=UPI003F54E363